MIVFQVDLYSIERTLLCAGLSHRLEYGADKVI